MTHAGFSQQSSRAWLAECGLVAVLASLIFLLVAANCICSPFRINDDSVLLRWAWDPDEFCDFLCGIWKGESVDYGRYQPLFLLSWALRFILFQDEPFGYFLVTSLEGIASVVLVYFLVRILGMRRYLSAFAALCILLGPHFMAWCLALPPDADGALLSIIGLVFASSNTNGKSSADLLMGMLFLTFGSLTKETYAAAFPFWVFLILVCHSWRNQENLKETLKKRKFVLLLSVLVTLLLVALIGYAHSQNNYPDVVYGLGEGSSSGVKENIVWVGTYSLFAFPFWIAAGHRISSRGFRHSVHLLVVGLLCVLALVVQCYIYRDTGIHGRYLLPASLFSLVLTVAGIAYARAEFGRYFALLMSLTFLPLLCFGMRQAAAGASHLVASARAYQELVLDVSTLAPDRVLVSFHKPHWVEPFRDTLHYYGLAPELITLELNEHPAQVSNTGHSFSTLALADTMRGFPHGNIVVTDRSETAEALRSWSRFGEIRELSEPWEVFSFSRMRSVEVMTPFFWIVQLKGAPVEH